MKHTEAGPSRLKKSCLNPRRCRIRMSIAFVTGVLVSTSVASWASFQYVGRPLGTVSAGSVGSSMYLPGSGASMEPPDLQGADKVFTRAPALAQKGAGIAWPCHGSGQGPLNKVLYRLLPAGWSLYAKPGTVLDLPTGYACHSNPWTTPLRQVLQREGYEGTLWWGYDVLSIAPRPHSIMPAVAGVDPAQVAVTGRPVIQPGGPMMPYLPPRSVQTTLPLSTKTDPVIAAHPASVANSAVNPIAACHGHGNHVEQRRAANVPLTLGPGGKVVPAGWQQHVIPLQKAVREGWQLALSKHPDARQVRLARAWLSNGGTLYYPLPAKAS